MARHTRRGAVALAAVPPIPYVPIAAPMHAVPRDLLTGAPLDPLNCEIRRVRMWYQVRTPEQNERYANAAVPPIRLTRAETDGPLGGLAYSLAFAKWLDAARQALADTTRRELYEWWRYPYGMQRVARGLRERMPDMVADSAMVAALSVLRDGVDVEIVAKRHSRSVYWVLKKVYLTWKLANRQAQD